jgi:hypothetical protein
MSKGNTFENDLLLLIFNNTNIANIGDATGLRGSSSPGLLYVSLHTSPGPDEGGDQATNEVTTTAYQGYARKSMNRDNTSAGWTVSGNSVSPAANIDFPACTGGTGATITHFAIGTTGGTAAGKVLYKGAVSPTITVTNGVTPRLTTATAITED